MSVNDIPQLATTAPHWRPPEQVPLSRATRRRLFARALIETAGNATAAAIAVNYSPKAAHVRAHRLLSRDDVARHLARYLADAEADPCSELGRALTAWGNAAVIGDDPRPFARYMRIHELAASAAAPRH